MQAARFTLVLLFVSVLASCAHRGPVKHYCSYAINEQNSVYSTSKYDKEEEIFYNDAACHKAASGDTSERNLISRYIMKIFIFTLPAQ